MKRLRLATAAATSALLFSFAAPSVDAQEMAVTTTAETKALEQLPVYHKVRAALTANQTYTYAIQVKNNELIELSAALYDTQNGDNFLIMPIDSSFVLKDDKGTVVKQGKFGNFVGESTYALFISVNALKAGNYTIEFATSYNDTQAFVEFDYFHQDGLEEIEEEPITPPETTPSTPAPSNPAGTTPSTPAPSNPAGTTPPTPAPSNPGDTAPPAPAPSNPGETTPPAPTPSNPGETTAPPTISEPAPSFKKASNLTVKLSKATVKPKAKVTVTNKAKGTSIKYKVAIKEKGGKNKIIQNYSTKKKTTFKAPTKKGTYTVTVYAKSSKGGKSIHKTKKLVVK